MKHWVARSAIALGIALVVAVAIYGNRYRSAEDATCHNPFRNDAGGTAVTSKLVVDLAISEQEWPELRSTLKEFARKHDWSFRDASVRIPGEVNAISVDLCAQNSLRILVAENHWRGTHAHDHPGRGLSVALFGDVPPEEWQAIARDLVLVLDAKWPGRVRFLGRHGRVTQDRPKFLNGR